MYQHTNLFPAPGELVTRAELEAAAAEWDRSGPQIIAELRAFTKWSAESLAADRIARRLMKARARD